MLWLCLLLFTDLRGRVVDGLTREPLARVALECGAAKAQTDVQGRFEIRCDDPLLRVSTVGYRPLRFEPAGSDLEIEIFPETFRRQESITVEAGAYAREAPLAAGLEGNELKNLASVLADDPLRSAQTLPGAASNDDFSSQFTVRGAPFERVGLYFDGVLMHTPFHTVVGEATTGSMTVFNGDLLSSLTLYPGAMPPRYGDRTAGALDLRGRDGDRHRLSGRATASASNAAGLVEGPLGRAGKGSWLAAVRQSYLQYIVARTSTDPTLAFGFTDGQGRLRYDLSSRHSATLAATSGASAMDRTKRQATAGANSPITSDYRFTTVQAGLRSSFESGWSGASSLTWMRERSVLRNRDSSPLYASGYGEWAAMTDWSRGVRSGALLEFGGSLRRMRDDGYSYFYQYNPAAFRPLEKFRGSGLRSGTYVQASMTRWNGLLTLSAGGRADHHRESAGFTAAPYAALALALGPATRFHLAWSHATQYPDIAQLYSLFGRTTLLPVRAQHVVASIDQRLGERSRLRVETWQRLERDLLGRPLNEPRIDDGRIVPVTANAPWTNTAREWSRGFQLLAQRRTANGFTGWIAYAYAKAWTTEGVTHRAYAADDDQRHTVQAYLSYRLRPTVNLSGRWVYGSGFPVPGFYRGTTTALFLAGERNQVRLPHYQRADVRINKDWQKKRARLTLFGEVVNILNRGNLRPDSYNGYNATTGRVNQSFIKMLPVLPSAGLLVEF